VLGYGLAALVKPLFALLTSSSWLLATRFSDRVKAFVQPPRCACCCFHTSHCLGILFAVYGLRLGMTQGVLLLVAEKVPAGLRGSAFRFLNLAVGISLLPASLLSGALWEKFCSAATLSYG